MFNMLFGGKQKNEIEAKSFDLYCRIVNTSRNPDLFINFDIEDTVDGRFDCIALHLGLFIRRLQKEDNTKDLLKTILSAFVSDMDRNLREMGVGDLSVGKQVKSMASAYQGRFVAYGKALDNKDNKALEDSLEKNLYRKMDISSDKLQGMAAYVVRFADALDEASFDALLAGELPKVQIS